MTVSPALGDLYDKQVFYCSENCAVSLNICTVIWTVFAALLKIIFLINFFFIFHFHFFFKW